MATTVAFAEAAAPASSFTFSEVEALLLSDIAAGAEDDDWLEMEDYAGGVSATISPSFSSTRPPERIRESNILNPENSWTEEKKKMAHRGRIGFRARSAEDNMNDGYKWRKYGKKAIKDSPNPRNYYRCATMGCPVKKRVQRDCEDANYVITIYDGVHNHGSH